LKAFYPYIIFFSFSLNCIYAQQPLTGKVVNHETGQPLSGASIYFNNTSIGTLSDNNGQFVISNPIEGELIISSVGYERLIFLVKNEQPGYRSFIFKLQEKQTVLQDVLVLPDATRKRYLKLFRDNFLGMTQEADRSKITNLNALYFVRSPDDKDGIIALSDTPLTIVNRQLGYRVQFDLVQFYLNEKIGRSSFYGYTRYDEMDDRRKWKKNRRNVYYGSTLHFYRALINDKLEEESYSIYKIKEDSLKNSGNSISSSNKMDIAIAVKAKDIVVKDTASGYFVVNWGAKMMVQYHKKPASKDYLSRKVMLNGSLPNGFRAYLHTENFPIRIDANGLLEDPMKIFYSGYWIYEKAASLLPYNYYHGND
jgi:hypothetical protein